MDKHKRSKVFLPQTFKNEKLQKGDIVNLTQYTGFEPRYPLGIKLFYSLEIFLNVLAEFLFLDLYVGSWLSQFGQINLKLSLSFLDASPSI